MRRIFGEFMRPSRLIEPTTYVDVVRLDGEGRRELVSMRWGLVPFFWKKSLKDVPAALNARAKNSPKHDSVAVHNS
jgi:putative SOS response-associated peptidase YedK